MKILLATGIFEPEAGGPATYTPRLAEMLVSAGHDVTVLTYSATGPLESDKKRTFALERVLRGNRLLHRIRFFRKAFRLSRGCNLIYTLDWFAAGLPVAFAAKLRGIPYVVRVGGDYLWEQRYLESGRPPLSLKDFYEKGIYRQYGFLYRVIRRVLSGAIHVVFNSDAQRELYIQYYGLETGKVSTIYNPVSEVRYKRSGDAPRSNEIVYWGRFIVMKNLNTLIRAFAQARLPSSFTLTLIGDGPQKSNLERLALKLNLQPRVRIVPSMPRDVVLGRVKDCRAFVLPSWTDISPNQVMEALDIGLPGLITKENYLNIGAQLPETIDPHSVEDVAKKLELLADDTRYADFAKRFNSIHVAHSWADVFSEHMEIFKKIVNV